MGKVKLRCLIDDLCARMVSEAIQGFTNFDHRVQFSRGIVLLIYSYCIRQNFKTYIKYIYYILRVAKTREGMSL